MSLSVYFRAINAGQRDSHGSNGLARFLFRPGRVDGKCISVTEQRGALDDVLQLADVSRPMVRLEQLQSGFLDTANSLARFLGVAVDEIVDEQRNVVGSLLSGGAARSVDEISA